MAASKISQLSETIRVAYALATVNFRLRIEGSYLGIFWYLLKPLAFFFVLLLVSQTAFATQEIKHFPLYLLIGIAGFNFFRDAIGDSIDVISNNPSYLKSINSVRAEALVISVIIQNIFSHIFEFLLIVILAAFSGVSILGLAYYLPILLLFAFFVLGLAFISATIGVFINDLGNIWAIAAQILLFATPIFYAIQTGGLLYLLNLANPLYHFLNAGRAAIISGQLPALPDLAFLAGGGLLSVLAGWNIFNRYKKSFAESL